jgi:hypothetical protein
MTQMSMAVAALNHDSKFAAAYEKGIKKSDYWHYALEDALSLIAKLPSLAARIFVNVYKGGGQIPGIDKSLDLIGRYGCFHKALANMCEQGTTATCLDTEATKLSPSTCVYT